MSFANARTIARRELRGGLHGFRIFLLCLTLGVAAIVAVGSVREAIRAGLQQEGATLLGGDAELELTYRFATEDERAWMEDKASAVAELVDFRSMAVFGAGDTAERGLTQVKAVDGAYPLLGQVILDPEMPLTTALDGTEDLPGAVMAPLLIARMGMKPGDRFQLGAQSFVLMAALREEPDDAGGGFSLGPRTIVRTADLAESGLIQPGTLFETEYKLRLAPEADLDALEREAETRFTGVRWRDRRNGAPGIQVFVDRLSSFLVLVGLAGLAVGGVGISAAVTSYLDRKTEVIATLKTLGADSRTIFQTYFLQIGAMTLIGLALGLALGGALPLVLAPVIEARLPMPAVFSLHPRPLAEAAVYGMLAALIFTLWPLARVEDVRAATLFRDSTGDIRGWPRARWIVLTAMLVLLLVTLAAYWSGLWKLTFGAAGGVIVAFAGLVLAARGVRWLARRLASRFQGQSAIRLALGAVASPGGEATSVVLSLGLGLSVLAAVGQIDANLKDAITRDLPIRAPSFFMVDIQPGQIDDFQTRLGDRPTVSKVESAPMLRGIITEINGRPADEVAGPHWVLRGDRGVTYSDRPPEGTKITHGDWWPEGYGGPAQVSFATEEALELGLELGDEITVNILGRDISAKVTSFREVDFSTAGIGFILSMNPGALAGAPHSFISTVYADAKAEPAILRDISSTYPNITAISVKDAITRVSDILSGIAAAITYGALATLITGGVVLIGAAAAGVHARTYEAAILKTLGASRRTVLHSFALRAALLGAAAGLVAIVAGGLAGWGVMRFVMETEYSFEPVSALLIVTGGVLATLVSGLLFAWRPLAARPARILRARE
ncbi:MAG: FtsX-like permease family protein [Silicimonas sp.]|nr:FtsX-like permease family protein [Silicimonas sp.]